MAEVLELSLDDLVAGARRSSGWCARGMAFKTDVYEVGGAHDLGRDRAHPRRPARAGLGAGQTAPAAADGGERIAVASTSSGICQVSEHVARESPRPPGVPS